MGTEAALAIVSPYTVGGIVTKPEVILRSVIQSSKEGKGDNPIAWSGLRIMRNLVHHAQANASISQFLVMLGEDLGGATIQFWKYHGSRGSLHNLDECGETRRCVLVDVMWGLSRLACPGVPVSTPGMSIDSYAEVCARMI